jgi:hypothetical protein
MPFKGHFDYRWLDDGRNMRLLKDLSYYSNKLQREFIIPEGEVTDGASIPQIVWSIEGGPFSGKYRKAAVIHDYLCRTKILSWKQAHRVLFEAMIEVGEPEFSALRKYRAVYRFGPRW